MGRAEQEGPRGSWPSSPRSRIHASIRLLAQIAHIIASGPHMEQIADQHLFMRKDLALEPIVEGLFHSPTVPLIIGQRQALACSIISASLSLDPSAGYRRFVRLNVKRLPHFRADTGLHPEARHLMHNDKALTRSHP